MYRVFHPDGTFSVYVRMLNHWEGGFWKYNTKLAREIAIAGYEHGNK